MGRRVECARAWGAREGKEKEPEDTKEKMKQGAEVLIIQSVRNGEGAAGEGVHPVGAGLHLCFRWLLRA